MIDLYETVNDTWEEACERTDDVPKDGEKEEREEDAKAAPSHLSSLLEKVEYSKNILRLF